MGYPLCQFLPFVLPLHGISIVPVSTLRATASWDIHCTSFYPSCYRFMGYPLCQFLPFVLLLHGISIVPVSTLRATASWDIHCTSFYPTCYCFMGYPLCLIGTSKCSNQVHLLIVKMKEVLIVEVISEI